MIEDVGDVDVRPLSARIRAIRDQLRALEADVEKLESKQRGGAEPPSELHWRLARAEQENARLHDSLDALPPEAKDYIEAQRTIQLLQREVEVYRHHQSVQESVPARRRWPFSQRGSI